MVDIQSQQTGYGPVQRIINLVFSILQTKFELIGIGLAEEKDRLLGLVILGLTAIMLALMTFIAFTVLIAVVFWDVWRWQVLAGITIVYACATFFCALKVQNRLRNTPFIFEATLKEFEKDQELFKK